MTGPGTAALAGRVAALRGWRRHVLAAALGAASAAAQPPVYALPLLIPAYTGLLWLVDGAPRGRNALVTGWWFGFGQFVAGLYWIGLSMLVEAEKFAWMIPFAVGGLSAALAVFPAAAVWLTWRSGTAGWRRVLVLAAAWTAAEWMRSWLLTGFPWNLAGQVWTASDAVLQFAALAGVHGLGLLTITVAAMPAVLGEAPARGAPPGRRWLPVAVAGAVLAVVWAGGALRLPDGAAATVPGVNLRIVQPNVPQRLKWRRDRRAGNFAQLLALSAADDGAPVSHVIWPETAVPYLLSDDPRLSAEVGAVAPARGAVITGAMRRVERTGGASAFALANSLLAVDSSGAVIASYDKFHLVPFGEYVPLRDVLPIDRLAQGRGDFAAGPGLRTLRLPGLPPVSPLICYEVAFPGRVADPADRPAWLLNLTNDAWFGTSSGPYQHFASARLRAVEEGLPLVRAANTGISGVIDPYGRVVASLGLNRTGVVDAPLPGALATATPFARFGDGIPALLTLILGMGGLVRRRRPRP